MVLLNVVMGLGIDGDGLGKLFLQPGDQMLFPAVKQLGNFRMDLYREAVAHHISGFGNKVPVYFVTDGFAR